MTALCCPSAHAASSALVGLKPVQPAVQSNLVNPGRNTSVAANPGQAFKDCQETYCPEMVVIPAGSFVMGSNDGASGEKPPRILNVRGFTLGKYEVTQGQWKAVIGNNPSYFSSCGDNCPVEQVSWDDIQHFLKKLNQMTGQQYRLPSEAEWEYAARAGTVSKYSWGDDIGHNNANCEGCGSSWDYNSTAPVGSFAPNAFGLYDMHGNVWEWVQDWYHDSYSGAPTDGTAWVTGGDQKYRVLRGGSWDLDPNDLRSASRVRSTPDLRASSGGFRLARTVP